MEVDGDEEQHLSKTDKTDALSSQVYYFNTQQLPTYRRVGKNPGYLGGFFWVFWVGFYCQP
jgi:hypothetical protein